MDKSYIIHFQEGSTTAITAGELLGIGANLDKGGAGNFQWLKRGETFLVLALDKIVYIEVSSESKEGVVTPKTPEEVRREKERNRVVDVSSTTAILNKLNKKPDEVS